MRLGVVILPERRWPDTRWRRAEEFGFDHAWTYDHLAWRGLRDAPWFAAMPTLTAAALATSTIRIGPLVASPNFRHPVTFAREVITLDDIAGGRLTLGIGSGGVGWDATILGQEPWSVAERSARFAEFVDLLDRLLREREVSFAGRFWSAEEARTHPGCVQQPRVPFAVAATGPRAMRVVARHADTWVTTTEEVSDVARQAASLDEACAAIGRDPSSLDRLVLIQHVPESIAELEAAYAAIGITDLVIPWPRPSEPYVGAESILESIAAERSTESSNPGNRASRSSRRTV
jgi:alkanesulfonate monooxygenase SsuD/methylene tetrahydromethanopterin reductase-like flavin-dependent oxidoreductase (luciferase family)